MLGVELKLMFVKFEIELSLHIYNFKIQTSKLKN